MKTHTRDSVIFVFPLVTALILPITQADAGVPDYVATQQTDGIYTYAVAQDAVTPVAGSPFNPTNTPYGTGPILLLTSAPGSEYLYALYSSMTPFGDPRGATIYTFKVVHGVATQTSLYRPADDFGSGGCGHCAFDGYMFKATPHHVFVVNANAGDDPVYNSISVFSSSSGVLSETCDINFDPEIPQQPYHYNFQPSSLQVDPTEYYLYVGFISEGGVSADSIGIYDLRNGCKFVGVIPSSNSAIFGAP